MTSKIKVDNISKVSDDSNIINKCGTTVTVGAASDGVRTGADNLQASDGGNLISQSGTTITLGASGDTITLASGASQSGFGRTGTVDWDTTPKTATFTAVSGDGFFCNTSGGAFTCNLPAGTAGAIVSLADYAGTFASNALTVTPNGSQKIGGSTGNATLDTPGQSVTFIYVDDTQGWLNIQDSTSNERAPAYITATGGNAVLTCGNFKTHVFTSPGTFCVSAGAGNLAVAEYLVIGGGAGAGAYGGGGAGGFRHFTPLSCGPSIEGGSSVPVNLGGIPITVGAGGTGASSVGGCGSNSIFSTITSAGGGGGGGPGCTAAAGGSGGGNGSPTGGGGGAGNTPPVNPPQGQPGGPGAPINGGAAGSGGGGALNIGSVNTTGAGHPGNYGGSGKGGSGTFVNPAFVGPTAPSYGVCGPSPARWYAGGGGGNSANGYSGFGNTTPGCYPADNGPRNSAPIGGGGYGRGADGNPSGPASPTPLRSETAGTANTGGGGGAPVANGGSGIVMIRYQFQSS
tara:strand:- start:86 stop:1627 length:1542 start_codon:yes stop_codon:yes gene_type:complete